MINIKSIQNIIIPIVIKFIGMMLFFTASKMIITINGIDGYGVYSQIYALIMLFIAILSIGLPQTLIKKTSGVEESKKIEIYQKCSRVIFTNCVISIPLIYFILFFFDIPNTTYISIIIYLVLNCTFRLRFSYLRTEESVKYSETPDLIIRQLIFLILVLVVKPKDIEYLILISGLSHFCGLLFQFVLSKKVGLTAKFEFAKKDEYYNTVEKNDIRIWTYNCMMVFSDFMTITIIFILLSPLDAGAFKILSQFSLGFVSIFNALNLVNSKKYAKLVSTNNKKEMKNKMKQEFFNSQLIYMIMFIGFSFVNSYISLFEFFEVDNGLLYTFYTLLIISQLNLFFGPISQLFVHYKFSKELNLVFILKIVLFLIGVYILITIDFVSLFSIVSIFVLVEFLYLLVLSLLLYQKENIKPAFLNLW